MANKLNHTSAQYLLSSMFHKLNEQSKQQEILEQQLHSTNKQLENAIRNLEKKQCMLDKKQSIINGLEEDLAHVVEQLKSLKSEGKQRSKTLNFSRIHQSQNQWIGRALPGLSVV